jgi:hypothetical protein
MGKWLVCAGLVLWMALPAGAATKTTLQELDSLMGEMYQQRKSDEAVATKLKDVELTEQMSTAAMNGFTKYDPGPLTTTQIRVLAVESALMPPPPSDLPQDPAPDMETQKAIMGRAVDYATKQYAHLPKLMADKQSIRFQDGVTSIQTNSGTSSGFGTANPGMNAENKYLLILGAHTTVVESENGVEMQPAASKGKDPAGQNGQVSQGGAGLVLGLILIDAGKGQMAWKRWETVDGKKTAVFSFAVDKKQSHYKVNYCCFPVMQNVGGAGAINTNPNAPAIMAQPGGTATNFKSFTTAPGYHGEIFVDPESGTVVRLITRADLKPSDLVHQEDIRVDYGPVEVDGKQYVVPVRSVIQTEVAPNGEAYVKYSTRRTYFDVNYQNYRMADVPAKGD